MRPELAARAASQGGVVTRTDAVECGYSSRELRTLTGYGGAWTVVRRGVYATRALWNSLDEDGRYVLGARAAHLNLREDAVFSHTSAAALQSLPIRPRWRALHHVTRPGVHGGRTEHGIKHHPAPVDATDLTTVGGIRLTALARTAVDIGRELGYEDGVVACDAALRRGVSRAELSAAMTRMWCWPRITAPRAAVAVADGGAESIGESLTRLLVLELGIGVPQTQFEIIEGDRTARADLRIQNHLFEFDGRIKYVGRERGGVADRSAEEILWAEKQREDWLRGLGFGVSRVVWSDLFGRQRELTRARLLREFRRTTGLPTYLG